MPPITIEDVQKAIALPDFDGRSAQFKMAPILRQNLRRPEQAGPPRVGSVLIMLYCLAGELHLILTRRRDDLNSHAGQVSFPGGKRDNDEPLSTTALRETYEEVGIAPRLLTILGQLTTIYILPSDFEVHPFVAQYSLEERPIFHPAPHEVAEIIEVPLRHLLDPATRQEEMWHLRGHELPVPFFTIGEHKVWGATAMMLSELVERLRTVISGQ